MTLEILVCKPDGTQTVELKEFPDNWLEPEQKQEKEAE